MKNPRSLSQLSAGCWRHLYAPSAKKVELVDVPDLTLARPGARWAAALQVEGVDLVGPTDDFKVQIEWDKSYDWFRKWQRSLSGTEEQRGGPSMRCRGTGYSGFMNRILAILDGAIRR